MADDHPKDGLCVGIIMDGNGRWATERGLPVTEGHRIGGETLHATVENALDLGVKQLTVYAFSTENWSRSIEEVNGIMQLFAQLLDDKLPQLHERGVRMVFPGRTRELPMELQARIDHALEHTAGNTEMTLAIAFNYGGRAEIIDAIHAAAAEVGGENITEEVLQQHLYIPELRDPDLVIRTAGESRMSNFLTWQSVYSEFVSLNVLWPDFSAADLANALTVYRARVRRFGSRAEVGVQ